jgi:hypothetical protein
MLTIRLDIDRCRGRKRSLGYESRSRRLATSSIPRLFGFPNVVTRRKSITPHHLARLNNQDLYTDEETSLSTAYPAEIRDTVNEKLNIKRRIRYRRNRAKGVTEPEGDLESASTRSGEVARVDKEEEDEEEQPQMSILATVVRDVPVLRIEGS